MIINREPTIVEWAMLAAYIDGEGHIGAAPAHSTIKGKRYDYRVMRITVSNTDFRLMAWLRNNFGGMVFSPIRPNKQRVIYHWEVGAAKAEYILRGCLPHFIIKGDLARVAIAYRETFSRKYGKRGLPPEIVERRNFLEGELDRLRNHRELETIQ
jgi:hypothetical protein